MENLLRERSRLTNHHQIAQNVHDHKISNEFDYGTYQTRTVSCLPLNLEKLPNLILFTYLSSTNIASANIDQSVPNLATIYMPMRSRMSSIMGQIEPEHQELFSLEFGKIGVSDCLHSSIYKY